MAPRVGQQEPSEVSAEQRTSSELVKRIRKLRWMGMQREAEALQARCAGASEALIACWRHPPDTD